MEAQFASTEGRSGSTICFPERKDRVKHRLLQKNKWSTGCFNRWKQSWLHRNGWSRINFNGWKHHWLQKEKGSILCFSVHSRWQFVLGAQQSQRANRQEAQFASSLFNAEGRMQSQFESHLSQQGLHHSIGGQNIPSLLLQQWRGGVRFGNASQVQWQQWGLLQLRLNLHW